MNQREGKLRLAVMAARKESWPRMKSGGQRCKARSAMQSPWQAPKTRSTATALARAQSGKHNGSHAGTAPSSSCRQCCLTPRSSRAPTAGHQARSGGTLYIFASPGLASYRWLRLSSNVRRHRMRIFLPDPMPGAPLACVQPIALRAKCWYARVWDVMPEDQCMHWLAAVTILSALEYHQLNYIRLAELLQSYFGRAFKPLRIHDGSSVRERLALSGPSLEEEFHSEALDNEAVAYFNRLGQFYYFSRGRELLPVMPRTQELIVFRHKHTAHRSADVQRKETPEEIASQSTAFGFARFLQNGQPSYQMREGEIWQTFTMKTDHPVVMAEAMSVLLRLHPCDDA